MTKHFLSFHTIFIMNENIDWIEEFLQYHLAIGFDHFYLYDNSESNGYYGSNDKTNKYGFEMNEVENLEEKWENIMTTYGDKITYVKWQPKDADGKIIYGQKEGIQDFIERYGSETEWVAFMDLDEFVFSQENIDIPEYFDLLPPSISCVRICQKKFKDRFLIKQESENGEPGVVIKEYQCIDKEIGFDWAPKNILRPSDFVGIQTVHDIKVKYEIKYEDPKVLRFNHYNVNPALLKWMKNFYNSEVDFTLDGVDDGMKRYDDLFVNENTKEVIKEQFVSTDSSIDASKWMIWIVVLIVAGLVLYATDADIFLFYVFATFIWRPIRKMGKWVWKWIDK